MECTSSATSTILWNSDAKYTKQQIQVTQNAPQSRIAKHAKEAQMARAPSVTLFRIILDSGMFMNTVQ